jgi:hypothetical protein
MREKNEMGEGGCMCVVGEKKKKKKKKKVGGYKVSGEKKKKKKKGKQKWGVGFTCVVGKKGE